MIGKVKFICRSTDSYLDKLDNIDWVVVATPNQTHYEIVKNCLSKGVNVFCEKSLTLDYETSLELYQIAEKNKCNLYVTKDETFIENIDLKNERKLFKSNLFLKNKIFSSDFKEKVIKIIKERG